MNKFDFGRTFTVWTLDDTWFFPAVMLEHANRGTAGDNAYHWRTTECILAQEAAERRRKWWHS